VPREDTIGKILKMDRYAKYGNGQRVEVVSRNVDFDDFRRSRYCHSRQEVSNLFPNAAGRPSSLPFPPSPSWAVSQSHHAVDQPFGVAPFTQYFLIDYRTERSQSSRSKRRRC
jgi:hypothetical protein